MECIVDEDNGCDGEEIYGRILGWGERVNFWETVDNGT